MIGLLFLILFLLFLLAVLFVIMFIYRKLKAPKAIRIMAALFIPLAPIVWFVSDEFIAERQLKEICAKANLGKVVVEPDKISRIRVFQKSYYKYIPDTELPIKYAKVFTYNSKTNEFLYQFEYFKIEGQSRFARLLESIYMEFKYPTVLITSTSCESADIPNLLSFFSNFDFDKSTSHVIHSTNPNPDIGE